MGVSQHISPIVYLISDYISYKSFFSNNLIFSNFEIKHEKEIISNFVSLKSFRPHIGSRVPVQSQWTLPQNRSWPLSWLQVSQLWTIHYQFLATTKVTKTHWNRWVSNANSARLTNTSSNGGYQMFVSYKGRRDEGQRGRWDTVINGGEAAASGSLIVSVEKEGWRKEKDRKLADQ